MGEVLILIIIALVWWFKAAVANEDKKVNDRETGSISASPDELIKKAKRTAEDLDALRGQTEKKRPSGVQIRDFTRIWPRRSARAAKSAGRSRAGSRPTAARCILSTWTAAKTGLRV